MCLSNKNIFKKEKKIRATPRFTRPRGPAASTASVYLVMWTSTYLGHGQTTHPLVLAAVLVSKGSLSLSLDILQGFSWQLNALTPFLPPLWLPLRILREVADGNGGGHLFLAYSSIPWQLLDSRKYSWSTLQRLIPIGVGADILH